MTRKTKIILIVSIIIFLILFAFVSRRIDTARIEQGKMPIFCTKMADVGDGGSEIYIGLGYKVIKYDKSNGFQKIEIGGWNLEYDPNLGEDLEQDSENMNEITE